jgi:ferredoxin-type protein NapH
LPLQLVTLAVVLAPLWWPWLFKSACFYQGNFAASRLRLGSWTVALADPFAALCVIVSAQALPWTLAGGAWLVLGGYVVVRMRSFCAWACPVHLMLEYWDRLLIKPGWRREAIGSRWPVWSNTVLTALVLLAAAVVGQALWEPINPVNTLVRSLQRLALSGLGLVAAVLAVETLLDRRVFCRHLCPMGGFYAAAHRAGVAGVAVDPATCTGCGRCADFCLAAPELEAVIQQARQPGRLIPVGLESPHCTLCLDCAVRCKHDGIVFHRRWRASREPAPRAAGAGTRPSL